MAADGHPHRAAGLHELVGDLETGLTGADDEDAARRQLGRVSIVVGVDRPDPGRQSARRWPGSGPAERAAGDDDGIGQPGARGVSTTKPADPHPDRRHVPAGPDRRRERRGIGLEVADHLGAVEESLGIRPAYQWPGSRLSQFGLTRRNVSQRRSATSRRSRPVEDDVSIPCPEVEARRQAAWPAPITTTGIRSHASPCAPCRDSTGTDGVGLRATLPASRQDREE